MKFTVLVYSWITAAAGLWHNGRSINTAGAAGNSTFSYYAQYSAHESSLVPWTEHNILTK